MGIFSKKKNDSQGASHADLHVVLEHSGTPLFDAQLNQSSKEITIGRSTECTWSLDGVDQSASSKHAMISRRKAHFYITDLGSRNGLFYQNKRIKERKLAPGDKINLGECTILVDTVKEKPKKLSKFHRLAYTNEKGRQIVVDISKPQMILGSAPDCDLIFHDQLISGQHAELSLKSDDSCWLRDLGSRNGTSVNGTELLPENERLLQDGDTITIAYLDIKFWDSASDHHESRIWSAVITIAVTLVVILGIYVGYGKLTPDGPTLVEIAKERMQSGDLDGAEDILLNSVPHADNSSDVQYTREQLLRIIKLWRATMKTWAAVQQNILSGQFTYATQRISTINGDDLNTWTWPNGAVEKNKAAAIKNLLDACSKSSGVLKNMQASTEDLARSRRELEYAMAEAGKYSDDYFGKTLQYAQPFLDQIDKTMKDDQSLQATLALLSVARPDYSAIVKSLSQISKESKGPVKARADKVLPAIEILNRETERIKDMIINVCELNFKAVHDFALDLPEGINYSSEKNIGTLKNQMIETVKQFKDMALQLSLIYDSLVKRGISPGQEFPLLTEFTSQDILNKVYRVDSLDYPLPKSSRTTPAGEYDKLLGIEFFYDYLGNVHTGSITLDMEELSLKPDIYLLKQNFLEIEKLVSFADRDENQWFNSGAFADYLAFCKKLLQQRDEIISKQLARQDKPDTREFLISRGIAAYLSPEGKRKSDLSDELSNSFSGLKKKILDLNREYNLAMPEEALQIRSRIIRAGLPGDSIVKKMWQQRPESGW